MAALWEADKREAKALERLLEDTVARYQQVCLYSVFITLQAGVRLG